MSDFVGHRLVNTFLRVKQRLESLLDFCRLHEHTLAIDEDDWEDRDRFRGPYQWDIEELENSISTVSTLIANLQQEYDPTDDQHPIPNYPLCKNGWTMEQIEQVDTERETQINLDMLAVLRLQTLTECIHKLNSQASPSHHEHHTPVSSSLVASADPAFDLLALPAEILLHIFSYISPCELVSHIAPTCRCFAELILTRLYSHLDLSNMTSVFDVPRLLEHLPGLRSLTLIDWENEVSALTWAIWFDVLTREASRLHTLHFRNVVLSPILICLVMEYFPHCLQTIVFDCQQHKTYEKFDLILCLLAGPTAQIKRVTASYQVGITNFGIAHLASTLPMLVELNLIYVEATDDQTIKVICDKHQPHLEVLRVDGAQLTDLALEAIGQCSQLQSILIEFCNNLTGSNFSIFQNFPFLKELSLSKLTGIPPECFHLIFNDQHRFPHLTTLKLGECHLLDDTCIQALVQACPRLIHLTCSWAYAVTDVGFSEIASRCDHLEDLSLIGCYQIYGDILNDVPHRYLRAIRSLNFEQCNHIQDELLLDLYRRKKTISIVNYYGSAVNEDDEE